MKLTLAATSSETSLRIDIDPWQPASEDRRAWVLRLLERDVADGAEVRVLGSSHEATEQRWPFELIEANVVTAGVVRERRVLAIFELFGYSSCVLARAPAPLEVRSTVLPIMRSARVDWHSRSPVALDELWSLARS